MHGSDTHRLHERSLCFVGVAAMCHVCMAMKKAVLLVYMGIGGTIRMKLGHLMGGVHRQL